MLIQHQQQELQALKSNHEEVEASLRDHIIKLHEIDYIPSKDEKIRIQKNQISELSHLMELIRDETKQIRLERDETVLSYEQYKANTGNLYV